MEISKSFSWKIAIVSLSQKGKRNFLEKDDFLEN